MNFTAIVLFYMISTCLCVKVLSQCAETAKQTVMELSKPDYYGRGYAFDGNKKAASMIAEQFKQYKLEKFNDSYFQYFEVSTNTLPGKLELKLDDRILVPGYEYVIRKSAPDTVMELNIVRIEEKDILNIKFIDSLEQTEIDRTVAVVDWKFFNYPDSKYLNEYRRLFSIGFPAWIILSDEPLIWWAGYGKRPEKTVYLEILKELITETSEKITITVDAEFLRNYQTQNVIGFISGEKSDEYIILCAHYDHLGMMGSETFFPGADDNATGVAVVLELAKYFAETEKKPPYSVIFACFGAEEIGFLGAYHFVNNSPVEHKKIKAVVNIDMVGFGENGFTVENAISLPNIMNTLETVISEKTLDIQLIPAPVRPFSDHVPFLEKGIPAIFITSGIQDSKYYHTVLDKYEHLSFAKLNELLILLRDFIYSF